MGASRRLAASMAAAFALALCANDAAPQSVPKEFWGAPAFERSRPGSTLTTQQQKYFLLWTGFYYGQLDGSLSQPFLDAIKRFQASLGHNETGQLSQEQAKTLQERGERAVRKADFRQITDDWTGISVSLPMGYLSSPKLILGEEAAEKNFPHIQFPALGSSDLSVRVLRFEGINFPIRNLLDFFAKKYAEKDNFQFTPRGDFALFYYEENGTSHIEVWQKSGSEVRVLGLNYPVASINIFAPAQAQIMQSLDLFAAQGLSASERRARYTSGRSPGYELNPEWMRTMVGSGSGSIVSNNGHVLTNYHVVQGCDRLTVNSNPAILVGVDIVNDLALLQSDAFRDRDPVRFRAPSAQLGEMVMVIGYPLFSLSQALNLTTGVVSARVGLYGDRRTIQVTAPIQPGNSGGAVLDRDGRQIAVVVAKASVIMRLEDSAENIGWVIRSDIAQDFMREHGVAPILDNTPPSAAERLEDVVTRARTIAVRLECHRASE